MSETEPANGCAGLSLEQRRSRLRSGSIEFKGLPELHALEENLRVSSFDRARIHAMAESLELNGLEQSLERMV
jgi:hypothetical protein